MIRRDRWSQAPLFFEMGDAFSAEYAAIDRSLQQIKMLHINFSLIFFFLVKILNPLTSTESTDPTQAPDPQ